MISTVRTSTRPRKVAGYFTNWERNLLSLTHELSGPLTAARLNYERYKITQSPQALELLSSNLKLMEDYLITARQQIKHQPMPAKPFSVNRQLAVIIRNLSPVAAQRSVAIAMNVAEDCGLRGNATRFKQIISCFIRNAIEAYDDCHHDNKSVDIEHYHVPGYLVISIHDHGNGISDEDKAKIFKPYFSTKRNSSGLGLGLSLAAQSISEDFNGRIKVSSDKSRGTEFSLFFQLPGRKPMLK